MSDAAVLVEVTRGGRLEGQHRGHALILNGDAEVLESWGNPDQIIFPRSSCKMVQALPLVESGAADAVGLGAEHLALACASHEGAPIHIDRVAAWLDELGIPQDALICGPQMPRDRALRTQMIKTDSSPCPIHNNCSGKHAGFLTLSQYLGGGADYVALDHPVQRAVHQVTAELAGEDPVGHGIDGCSAPNFALSLVGFGRQMAAFARAPRESGVRPRAMTRLINAMRAHPDLVAGEGRACTRLVRALDGQGAVKTGAEGVFAAILPELDRAIVLKIEDGATRASEAVMAALLIRVGALAKDDPVAQSLAYAPLKNFAGLSAGQLQPAATLIP